MGAPLHSSKGEPVYRFELVKPWLESGMENARIALDDQGTDDWTDALLRARLWAGRHRESVIIFDTEAGIEAATVYWSVGSNGLAVCNFDCAKGYTVDCAAVGLAPS